MRFVTWQPVLTDHQAFTYEELSRQSGRPVDVYVSRLQDSVRQSQGWADTQVRSLQRRLLPTQGTLRHCYRLLQQHRADTHLFGSPFEQPMLMLVMLMAALLRIDFYLVSEPYSPSTTGYFDDASHWKNRLKALLRPLVYRFYGLLIRRRTSGVFAISSLAIAQFQRSGIARDKLFPFGYFVPKAIDQAPASSPGQRVAADLRLVFVGSLIQRKGLDLLIAAVQRLRVAGAAVALDVFGPGAAESFAFDGEAIRYRGLIAFGHAQPVIAGYHMLVLPSRYDGWGVVVNEALLAGVPVLCSNRVGARTVVQSFGAGAVFDPDDVDSLAAQLQRLVSQPHTLAAMQAATRPAADAIAPATAARYMLAVIDAEPGQRASIVSPWYGASCA